MLTNIGNDDVLHTFPTSPRIVALIIKAKMGMAARRRRSTTYGTHPSFAVIHAFQTNDGKGPGNRYSKLYTASFIWLLYYIPCHDTRYLKLYESYNYSVQFYIKYATSVFGPSLSPPQWSDFNFNTNIYHIPTIQVCISKTVAEAIHKSPPKQFLFHHYRGMSYCD